MSDTAVYEQEAAATRERIAATIDNLQARLSPKAIVGNAVEELSARGDEALTTVRDAVMRHPVVIGATGIAIGVGLFARKKVQSATIEYGDSYAAYADYDDGYAADLAADDIPQGPVGARIGAIQQHAHRTAAANPIAIMAAGLATGVVIGAIVPVSATERQLAGDVGARIDAAVSAAVDAAKTELDFSKFSFAGGTAGMADRAVASLMTVLSASASALLRNPKSAA